MSQAIMTICVYDNPATMARECWQNGTLLYHYKAQLLSPFATTPVPPEHFFFGANTGTWQPGRIVGDAAAMTG